MLNALSFVRFKRLSPGCSGTSLAELVSYKAQAPDRRAAPAAAF
jgi:hypothetical protein